MSGKIRDFSKPDPDKEPGVQVLSAVKGSGVQVNSEPQPVEVKVHEEVIREAEHNVRVKNPEEKIEGLESVRIRDVRDKQAWDDVKGGRS